MPPKRKSPLKLFSQLVGIEEKSITKKLLATPKKDRDRPHQFVPQPNMIHQADTLFTTNDEGYRYALIVVDIADGKTEIEPMRQHSGAAVVKALEEIYSRDILDKPKMILATDQGSEFKNNTFKRYLTDNNIYHKLGRVKRSRQQAWAENRNGLIGRMISVSQHNDELITGVLSRIWVEHVPAMKQAINDGLVKPPYKPSTTKAELPVCGNKKKNVSKSVNMTEAMKQLTDKQVKGKGPKLPDSSSCNLLAKGTKVRVILDYPIGSTGARLHGKFRAGDMRWSKKVHTIRQVVLKPNNPPLYLVSDIKGTAYTRAQLQLVTSDELPASRKAQRSFLIEKFLDKRTHKGRIQYLVKWKDYDKSYDSWEPRTELMKTHPDVVKQFDADFRKKKG